jgi:signal transduction histidine kinase
VFREQRAFERELGSLVATTDHMLALTAAAQQATMAKADFVASMSHELRTPLNAVIGYSQILLEDASDQEDEEFAGDVKRIHGAGTHLLRMVDDILDFSKLDAGKMTTQASPGTLARCLTQIAGEAAPEALGTAYTLDCQADDQQRMLNVDWHSLKKALLHVIYGIASENDSGTIEVRATAEDSSIAVTVVDPKVRKEPAANHNLFDIFSDDSDKSATKYGGVGIAFALALKFTKLLQGDIAVSADSEGRRHFVMTVPLQIEALAA